MVDRKAMIKLLGGTIARGVLWATAALSAKLGVDAMSEDAATAVGMFVAAALLTAASTLWSRWKDKKLAGGGE